MPSWFQRLLVAPVTPEFRAQLPALAKAQVAAFDDAGNEAPVGLEALQLDAWYHGTEGREVLQLLFNRLWSQMSGIADWAMPAHDSRHAMYKVPSSALEYIVAEEVQGYERVGVFGALLHDHGRWAEERVFGGPGHGPVHARLSFLLARELMADLDMPGLLRAQILRAVAQHTRGANPADPMATKLTVSADRDQLYGPEVILRLMHHAPNADGSMGAILRAPDGSYSVFDKLTRFCFNRLPGPLFSRQSHVDELRDILSTFLLMAQDKTDVAERLASVPPARIPSGFDVDAAWARADALRPNVSARPEEVLRSFLDATHRAPSEDFLEQAVAKLESVPPEKLERLIGAVEWARLQRVAEDARQRQSLQAAKNWFGDDPVLLAIAKTVERF